MKNKKANSNVDINGNTDTIDININDINIDNITSMITISITINTKPYVVSLTPKESRFSLARKFCMTNSITKRLADCTKPIEEVVKRVIDKYDAGTINDYIDSIKNNSNDDDIDDYNEEEIINIELNIGGNPYTISVSVGGDSMDVATKFCIDHKDTFNIIDSMIDSHCIQPIFTQLKNAIIKYKESQ